MIDSADDIKRVNSMSSYLEIRFKLDEKGILTSKEMSELGINTQTLSYWTKVGKIKRVARGIYSLPDALVDTLYVLQLRCKKGVYSHETALYLHGVSDRTPLENIMTVPSGYNVESFSEDPVSFRYINSKLHKIGVTQMKTSHGNMVSVYDLERTICDIIRSRETIDKAIVNSALREYMTLKNAQPVKLSLYSKKLGMTKLLNDVMGVLF